MQLFLLTSLVMIAFAANSVLNRIGVTDGAMAPMDFALVRVWAGAVMLVALVVWRDRGFDLRANLGWIGPVALIAYLVGFSLAYVNLDAGLGALILFGTVQMTMFAVALARGDVVHRMRWIGAWLALVGLVLLLLPGPETQVDLFGAAAMIIAGVGWGAYTLSGAGAARPLVTTAANFAIAALVMSALLVLGLPSGNALGFAMAVLAGAVTSALGYALWYRILPQLETSLAATAQLSVPVIAALGGVIFLSEPLTLRFVIASILVLGGIGLSLRRAR